MAKGFPRTISRGPLKGRAFSSRQDYRAALAAKRGVAGRTEYAIRSERAKALGFRHYAELRKAQKRGEFPTARPGAAASRGLVTRRGFVSDQEPMVDWRLAWWDGHDMEKGARAPRVDELPGIERIIVHIEGIGFRSILVDGTLPSREDAIALAARELALSYGLGFEAP